MRKAVLWLMLAALLLVFSGCTTIDGLSRSEAQPDLRLLERPVYHEEPPAVQTQAEAGVLRLDLWLDGTQVMGGINPAVEGMYPHASRKYREGGFHYRYKNTTGMYETVLRCMLSSVEGSRVRLLRYGNERLPDSYLTAQGLASADASSQQLRSIRRDMLTYAIDPMPTVFSGFSAEKMTDSFYSPGTPKLNQLGSLNTSFLENPALAGSMSLALDEQINSIANGKAGDLFQSGSDSDYPLLYALDNIDLSRLSVITCDPAAIRRLSAVDGQGSSQKLLESLLKERGVFEQGLSAGVYAFTLDYMGQLASFGAADLSEPLLWGRLHFNNSTGKDEGELVMPRTMLALVVGQPAQVKRFAAAFEKQLADSETLRVPRGPQKGELTYAQNGQTIVQEPFGFDYEYMLIGREQVDQLTQYTPGAALTADDAPAATDGSLTTITLAPVDGVQPDRTLTLTLPIASLSGGMTMDVSSLNNIGLTVQQALILTDVLPNRPGMAIPEGAQSIALRDQVYLFQSQDVESPVACTGLSADGETLTVQLNVDGESLKPGYYRMLFSADLPGGSMQWQTPEWVRLLNATLTNEQISTWETFSQLLHKYESKRNYLSRPYQHAWGDADNLHYYGEPVPEFPPVMKAPGLSELVSQLQSAAQPGDMPYIRYVFDLFVTNQP